MCECPVAWARWASNRTRHSRHAPSCCTALLSRSPRPSALAAACAYYCSSRASGCRVLPAGPRRPIASLAPALADSTCDDDSPCRRRQQQPQPHRRVAVAALHLKAGGDYGAARKAQLKGAVEAARALSTTGVLLGDLNVRDEELRDWLPSQWLHCAEAQYENALGTRRCPK